MIQLVCPRCGKRQAPAIRVQTMPPPKEKQGDTPVPYDPRRSMAILLLALSIFGLPVAYWLCQHDAAAFPLGSRTTVKYSYQCGLCGYAWSRICEEEQAPVPAPLSERGAQPALTAGEKDPA